MSPYRTSVELPATEEAARTHLAIPMSPVLDAVAADEVTQAVRAALASTRAAAVAAAD